MTDFALLDVQHVLIAIGAKTALFLITNCSFCENRVNCLFNIVFADTSNHSLFVDDQFAVSEITESNRAIEAIRQNDARPVAATVFQE